MNACTFRRTSGDPRVKISSSTSDKPLPKSNESAKTSSATTGVVSAPEFGAVYARERVDSCSGFASTGLRMGAIFRAIVYEVIIVFDSSAIFVFAVS